MFHHQNQVLVHIHLEAWVENHQKEKMASSSSSKFLRRLSISLNAIQNHSRFLSSCSNSRIVILEHLSFSLHPSSSSLSYNDNHSRIGSRDFCSQTSNLNQVLSQGPAAIDYRFVILAHFTYGWSAIYLNFLM